MVAIELPVGRKVYTKYVTVWDKEKQEDVPLLDQCEFHTHYGEVAECAPAIAIAGAAASVSAGYAAMTAVGATFGAQLLGGMMIAGGIFTGLGTLTGNKTLSTLGMGLSAVGGIGYGLSNATTGSFDLFSGGSFSDTRFGKAFSAFTGDVTGAGGAGVKLDPNLVDTAGLSGDAKISAAMDTGGLDTSASSFTNDLAKGAGSSGIDLVNKTPPMGQGVQLPADTVKAPGIAGTAADAAKPVVKPGMMSEFGSSKDVLSLASGMADGYAKYNDTKANAPVRDSQIAVNNANKNAIEQQTEFNQKRADNMLAQDIDIGFKANPSASPYASQLAQQGKFGMRVNGRMVYVSAEEYAALQRQKAQQQQLAAQQGGGLILTA